MSAIGLSTGSSGHPISQRRGTVQVLSLTHQLDVLYSTIKIDLAVMSQIMLSGATPEQYGIRYKQTL